MAYEVTLITGDGTGPELADAARRCIEATGIEIHWDIQPAGIEAMEQTGTPIPPGTLDSIRRTGCALKAPITTPAGAGFRSINAYLRRQLDLFACIRPCKTYAGVQTHYRDLLIDLVIIRESTEDHYVGIEFPSGQAGTEHLISWVNSQSADGKILTGAEQTGVSLKAMSVAASERVVRMALEVARAQGRRKVTVVHKASILKATDGLFLKVAMELAQEFPEIEMEERIVDNLCMQLVRTPDAFDVLVLPNLYGDIVGDLAAGLVGGLGVAPGANFGPNVALFEAAHGSAPKYRGLNKVNPTGLILAGALMLRHLGQPDAAARLESAVADVIAEGTAVTYDLKAPDQAASAVGTREMAQAISDRLRDQLPGAT